MDARPLMPLHQIPLTEHTLFKADSALVNKAHAAKMDFLQAYLEKLLVRS